MTASPIEDLDKQWQRLVRLARKARKRAYAPYSRYLVGCAILDDNGRCHTGCNVENASYPAALCAERAAIAKMVARGGKACRRLVVVTSSEEPVFPCGVCLQVLAELGRDCQVIAVGRRGTRYRSARFDELFPHAFSQRELSG